MQTIKYRDLEFEIPVLNKDLVPWSWNIPRNRCLTEFEFRRQLANASVRTIESMNSVWDQTKFGEIHGPVSVRHDISIFPNHQRFNVPRILDMPVKFPHNDQIIIPGECSSAVERFVMHSSLAEQANNPNFNQYYAYLTVDSHILHAGETHRHCGFHVDGFQGSRIVDKTLLNHSYIATDVIGTEWLCQSMPTDWSTDTDDFFKGWDANADVDCVIKLRTNKIYMLSPYVIHRCPVYRGPSVLRTFYRLSFDVRPFDRLGNTHNPHFDYDWDMVPRNKSAELKLPT